MARPQLLMRGRSPFMFGRAWRFIATPFFSGALGMSAPPTILSEGAWGGEQVMFMVGADKAVLRLGCAEGELPAPIQLDAAGHFSSLGLFTAHEGGPSTPAHGGRQVRFEGTVAGQSMTLTVRQGSLVETYRLTHGLQSKVIRCL